MRHNLSFKRVHLGVLATVLCLPPKAAAIGQQLNHAPGATILREFLPPQEVKRDSGTEGKGTFVPSSGQTTMHVELAQSEIVTVTICEPLGRELWRKYYYLFAGPQDINFEGHALPVGTYYCKVRSEKRRWATTMTIEP